MVRRRRKKNNFLGWLMQPFIYRRGLVQPPDMTLLIVIGLLLFLGLVFLSSASSSLAFFTYGDTYYFVKQQLFAIFVGLAVFYILLRINYKHYQKLTPLLLIVSIIVLLLPLFGPLQGEFGTAKSWIVVGGHSFQTSEVAKLFFILYLAGTLSKKGAVIKSFKTGTLPFIIILGIICALIVMQPDIGTLSIIVLTSLGLFFVAGAKISHIFAIIMAGLAGFFALIKMAPYRLDRITAWLDPNVDPQGIGYQVKQSLIAIGSGSWFGVGLGSSRQKSYLPHPANDSIFAVIAEEIGFIFTIGFIILFFILMYRGFMIAKNSDNNFAKLIALGITIWISVQFFINVAGIIKLLPLTGVPLPFVSLGGSNLVATLAAMGILANISRFTKQ
jgi:cell division protein FtsW